MRVFKVCDHQGYFYSPCLLESGIGTHFFTKEAADDFVKGLQSVMPDESFYVVPFNLIDLNPDFQTFIKTYGSKG